MENHRKQLRAELVNTCPANTPSILRRRLSSRRFEPLWLSGTLECSGVVTGSGGGRQGKEHCSCLTREKERGEKEAAPAVVGRVRGSHVIAH